MPRLFLRGGGWLVGWLVRALVDSSKVYATKTVSEALLPLQDNIYMRFLELSCWNEGDALHDTRDAKSLLVPCQARNDCASSCSIR
jgi:hypothetical protein